jgi:methionyl-tRNA formyltransferase
MKFSILAINNNRSKAYLQNLIKNGFVPNKIIFINDKYKTNEDAIDNDHLISKTSKQKSLKISNDLNISYDEREHILQTAKKNKIKYIELNTINVNSKKVIDALKKTNDKYILYSGPSGTILGTKILSCGKKFIHAHPGYLPHYKGSTTIYYSILLESKIGCSIILMEKEIDKGPILFKQEYKIQQKFVDFDYIIDPLVRAKTLINFFKTKKIRPIRQNITTNNSMFYIIHPLLKHISIINHNNKKN